MPSKHEHGFQPIEDGGELSLGDLYRILFAGRWFIIASVIVAVVAALWLNSRMTYIYRATSTAMVVSNSPWDAGILLENMNSTPAFSVADQLQILSSRRLARSVVSESMGSTYADRMALLGFPDAPRSYSEEQAIDWLLKHLNVKQVQNSNVISIAVEAPSGFEAAWLANSVASNFYRQNQELSRAEFTELTDFLKDQLDQVTAKLQNAESQLTSFKEGSKLSALDVETATIVGQSAQAQAELNRIKLELQSNQVSLDNLQRQYSQGQSSLVSDVENLSTGTITQLSLQIAEKQTQIANIRARAEAGWENYVRRLEDELRTVKDALKEETQRLSASEMKSADPLGTMQQIFERIIDLEVENRALQAARDAQAIIVQEFEARLSELPEASLEYVRYTREVEINEKLYLLLKEKYQENQAVAAGMIGNVRLLDEAEVPEIPVRPNKKLNLVVALLVGLLLGTGVSFLYHLMDSRLVTPEDIKGLGLDLMGQVPAINVRKLERALDQHSDKFSEEDAQKIRRKLITHFSPKSPISEAYRSLRTTVLMKLEQAGGSREAGRGPAIMITSSTTQEGKSLTSANLAVTLAQTNRRVLVIDSDMRRPTAHKNFNIERTVGLSGVLAGSVKVETAISETDIDNLFVLSAGPIPANPSELLSSSAMHELLEWARRAYDFVIVDSPPIVPVTDPTVLSRMVDGVMLVVRSNSSHKREVGEALSRIEQSDGWLMGAVLNDYDMKRVYGSYYYYYHYYNRYYYYGDGRKRSRPDKVKKRGRRSRPVEA